jgi:hypothetical protein
MIEKAARIGERIRSESGVDAAVQTIHYQIILPPRDRNKKNKMEAVVDTMSHEVLVAGEHHHDPLRTNINSELKDDRQSPATRAGDDVACMRE